MLLVILLGVEGVFPPQMDVDFSPAEIGFSPTLQSELVLPGEGHIPSFFSPSPTLPPPHQAKGQGLCLIALLCLPGKRWSTACAYLHPALSRPNLTAEAQTFVNRVLFEGTRAVGVEYIKNGQSHRVSELLPGWCSRDGRE